MLKERLRFLGGVGLLVLAISSVVVAVALHSPEPYGLGQLGVWMDQVVLALFALSFIVVGVLTILLRHRSSPAIAGLLLTAIGTCLVFEAGAPIWLWALPASVAVVLSFSVSGRSDRGQLDIETTRPK